MSARVGLIKVEPTELKGKITDPVHLKITFEVYEDLPEAIEFETVVAWDGDYSNDQVLDSIEVGPLKAGKHQFVLDAANVPDYSKVKDEDVTDVCVLFLHCAYRGNRFASVAFYISNNYTDEELIANPPEKPQLDKLERIISTDDVRVTTFQIKWADTDVLEPPVEEENLPETVANGDNGIADDLPIAV